MMTTTASRLSDGELAACGKRKRQVQELLAARFPQPDVACSIRKLPAPRSEPMSEATSGLTSSTSPSAERVLAAAVTSSDSSGPSPIPAPPPPLVQPLSPDRYRITFTASRETCEMLEMAQDLLRHAIPSGDPAQIVGRALQVLVEDLVRRKFAVARRPRASRGQADESRNIPAEVRRTVFIRDRGRCRFISTRGRRCGERAFVEFHHLIPYAAGGGPTVDNIALRCRAHNAYEAEVFYGPIRDCRSAAEDAGADVAREAAIACHRRRVSFRNDDSGHRGRTRPQQVDRVDERLKGAHGAFSGHDDSRYRIARARTMSGTHAKPGNPSPLQRREPAHLESARDGQ
jgi:hypothetical protein